MAFSFPHYTQIKNRYCVGYFGNDPQYLEQLILARPIIEETFPGIEIHIACKDSMFEVLKEEPNRVAESQLRDNRRQYAYIRVINYNMKTNPVADLLKESGVDPAKIGL